MMIAKKTWIILVVALAGLMSVGLSAANAFVPGVEDVKDPLGRPSALAQEVIFSASEFDRISGILVPKHQDLTGRILVLNDVATRLERVTGAAGDLAPLAGSINTDTTGVVGTAVPLPKLIAGVTARAEQANASVAGLNESVSGVTGELERVVVAQQVINRDLRKLGPIARAIAVVLRDIEESSKRLRPVTQGPLPPLSLDPPSLPGPLDVKP